MTTSIDSRIRALLVAVDNQIMMGRRKVNPNWSACAVKKTQETTTGLYGWVNDVPMIGRKQANGYIKSGMSTQSFYIYSEEQGLWLEIKKSDFRDMQKSGMILDAAGMLGKRIEEFPQDLVYGWLKEGDQVTYNGRPNLAYDGLSFFNDAHYVNGRNTAGGTYDNNLTGTALSTANAPAVEAALSLLPDNRGKALNQPLTDVIVPPQLGQTAADIFLARTLSTGGENMNSPEGRARRGLQPVRVWIVPELGGDATTYYFASMGDGRAGVILQETEALHVIPLIEENMPNVLQDNLYVWAAKGELNVGWGDPRCIIRAIA